MVFSVLKSGHNFSKSPLTSVLKMKPQLQGDLTGETKCPQPLACLASWPQGWHESKQCGSSSGAYRTPEIPGACMANRPGLSQGAAVSPGGFCWMLWPAGW